ncbi:methyltransferase domain-containing protein [Candidatus Sumerlaeota bacterium]|nr:methyltransferase domain-containing protein [Candidatus Sumerlaeota bacterium]
MTYPWLNLQCPDCASRMSEGDERKRACPNCGRSIEERNGVLYALPTSVENARLKNKERRGWQTIHGDWNEDRRRLLLNLPFAEGTELESAHYRQAALEFEFVRDYLSPLTGKRGLDLGGQAGWASYRFSQLGAEMVCVDYNDCPQAGLRAGEVYLREGVYFKRICADAEVLPLVENQFDFAFSSAFLHHLPNPSAAVRHVSRVLKPGGVYFATLEAFCPFWMTRRRAISRCDLAQEFIAQGINEQVFHMREYKRWFRAAGLSLRVMNPRWDSVQPGMIAPNQQVGRDGHVPEILENRRNSRGITGTAARGVLASGLWRLFALPSVFPFLRGLLLSGTQKFRVLVGNKEPV